VEKKSNKKKKKWTFHPLIINFKRSYLGRWRQYCRCLRLQNWRKYKKRKRKEDGLVERREKTIKTPVLSNLIFSSFLVHFEEFKKLLVWYLKLYKSTWKHRDSERMHKKFKLQNENCFFEPTSNHCPFCFQKTYLVHSLNNSNNFVVLNVPHEGLQNLFLKSKGNGAMFKDL
jgi:hypothetical protein